MPFAPAATPAPGSPLCTAGRRCSRALPLVDRVPALAGADLAWLLTLAWVAECLTNCFVPNLARPPSPDSACAVRVGLVRLRLRASRGPRAVAVAVAPTAVRARAHATRQHTESKIDLSALLLNLTGALFWCTRLPARPCPRARSGPAPFLLSQRVPAWREASPALSQRSDQLQSRRAGAAWVYAPGPRL